MSATLTLGGPVGAGPTLSTREIDQARVELLRRRIGGLAIVVGLAIMALPALALLINVGFQGDRMTRVDLVAAIVAAAGGVAIMVLPRLRRQVIDSAPLTTLVRRMTVVIVLALLSQVGPARQVADVLTDGLRSLGFEGTVSPIVPLAALFAAIHTAASFIVPWTMREAFRPCLTIIAIEVLATALSHESPGVRLFGLGLAFAACVPGLLVTWLRRGAVRERLTLQLLSDRYLDLQRELSYARRLHERLFPPPLEDPLRLAYRYEPMDQIGGDFLQAAVGERSTLVALVDVTGHGVAAALAVNRLHGEIKRGVADDPEATPERVLADLNRYVHLTLADERVFATAIVLRVWPHERRVRYASAGHPPMRLLRRDGSDRWHGPTAPLLGALGAAEFEAVGASVELAPGDVLLLYTDGAIEARDAGGEELGLEGFAAMARSAFARAGTADALVDELARAVQDFRGGAPKDDMLLVAVEVA